MRWSLAVTWMTPRLNGFKYFEKPVFQYWMTAVAFKLFGESNATARLWVQLIEFAGALWKHLHIAKGLLLLLVTAPWFIMVSLENPEFAQFFFIHEHFDRYTSNVHGRNQGLWFFPVMLILGMFPWVGRGLHALGHSMLAPYLLLMFPALARLMASRIQPDTKLDRLPGWHMTNDPAHGAQ